MDPIVDPAHVEEPTAPPVVPPVTPPPAAPPAEPPATPPAQPPQQGFSEAQWVDLEKKTNMTRQQLTVSWAFAQSVVDNDPVIARTAEKAAVSDARDSLAEKKITDFDTYSAEVQKELKKKSTLERRNSAVVESVYFEVKGRRVSEAPVPDGGQPPASPPADLPAAPSSRRVSGVRGDGFAPPEPTSPAANDKTGLTDFEKQVAEKYEIGSTKEFRSVQNTKEVDLKDEYNFKPNFRK